MRLRPNPGRPPGRPELPIVGSHAGLPSSVVEPGHGADRAAAAALDLQGEADEAEAAFADQLVEVDEAFHVRDAEVAAHVMHLEVVAPDPARAHGLDAEHHDALLAEPGGRLLRQARE